MRLSAIIATVLGLAVLAFAIFVPPMLRCVVAGTVIATPIGDKLIEDLRVGDAVWTRSPDGQIKSGRIVNHIESASDEFLELKFANGMALKVTAEHPLSTPIGWRKAGVLQRGERVDTIQGESTVESVRTQYENVRVFDLTIDSNPNFFANGILVHNKMRARSTHAAAACKALTEAQFIYHRTDYDKDGVVEYAQSIGGDSSLFESKAGLSDLALVDRATASAEVGHPKFASRNNYSFKILKAQGAHAEGGPMSYLENGNMTKGFAIIAFPIEYKSPRGEDDDPMMTYIVSHHCVIYEQDLGRDSAARARAITEFDPDTNWKKCE